MVCEDINMYLVATQHAYASINQKHRILKINVIFFLFFVMMFMVPTVKSVKITILWHVRVSWYVNELTF